LFDQSAMASCHYYDLDMDGFSERVVLSVWNNTSTSVQIFAHNGILIEQLNFKGFFHPQFNTVCDDYDQNGQNEVYFITYTEDSCIYLNSFEMLGNHQFIEKQKFVTQVNFHNKKIDIIAEVKCMANLNHDKYKEVLFILSAGYSLQPRKIYAFDIHRDSIFFSPRNYARIIALDMTDIDKDGECEILCHTTSPGNTKENCNSPYNDHSGWLVILDRHLNYKVLPKNFGPHGTVIYPYRFDIEGETYTVALIKNLLNGPARAELALFDKNFNILKKKDLNPEHAPNYLLRRLKIKQKDEFYLFDSKSLNAIVLDADLKFRYTYTNHEFMPSEFFDIDLDGTDEIIGIDNLNTKLYIARADLSDAVAYDIPESLGYNYLRYSIRQNGPDAPQFSVQRGNKAYLLNYEKNAYYLLKYPFYLVLYTVLALFFYVLMKVQKKRIEEKYSTERKIAQLQIRSIKNQTDPHFIFNALNTISSLIYREDKDTAYNILNDFSALIRSAIVNSDKISLSLAEELEFVNNYLKIEKVRFKKKFDYQLDIAPEVHMQTMVPRMVIQTYAENAIKHGIMHASHNCLVKICIQLTDNKILITIEDNGIGRENAKKHSALHMGKGLKIMDTIYQLYEKLNGLRIKHLIHDLKDTEGNGTGTRVLVEIPI
jgi:hypothetical protein